MSPGITVAELAASLGVELQGPGEGRITAGATLEAATDNELSFLANPAYKPQLATTKAGAVIVSPDDARACNKPALISKNPYATWAKALDLLHPVPAGEVGVAKTAVIDPTAKIDPSACVGEYCVVGPDVVIGPGAQIGPHCVIEAGAHLGANTRLVAHVFIAHHCWLGDRVLIHPGVVIGADGFGIAMDQGRWQKVPQIGRVVIGDDCEVGANTTIDRGALGDTVLAEDVRIDNQVQIAHNVKIGAHTAIAGCVGIAGSTSIGAYCMIAGASGIGGHLQITDRVIITAMSTVVSSIDTPGTYGSGIPALPHQRWKRILVRLGKLDEWIARIRKIEKDDASNDR